MLTPLHSLQLFFFLRKTLSLQNSLLPTFVGFLLPLPFWKRHWAKLAPGNFKGNLLKLEANLQWKHYVSCKLPPKVSKGLRTVYLMSTLFPFFLPLVPRMSLEIMVNCRLSGKKMNGGHLEEGWFHLPPFQSKLNFFKILMPRKVDLNELCQWLLSNLECHFKKWMGHR